MKQRPAYQLFLIGMLAAVLMVSAAVPVIAQNGKQTPQQNGIPGKSAPAPNAFDYDSPLVIPAAAFRSDGFYPGTTNFWFALGYMVGTGSYGCVQAPAYLPQLSNITAIYASIYDNDASNNVSVNLNRMNNYSETMNNLAAFSTTTESTAIQTPYDASITYPAVIYPDYSYFVTICLHTNQLRLYSVRIYFSGPYSAFLPSVRK